ncbi:MAG TPA: LysE family transporter [Stellaceae bacterium]|nr:LysE family transporter [Stellaceae bacterium]
MPDALTPLVIEGFVLGWSVAWAPGPINAELIRRTIGRGFLTAYVVALGASSGDAVWAMVTAAGAGLFLTGPVARIVLGVVSTILLLALAAVFLAGAWHALKSRRAASPPAPGRFESGRAGYALGLGMALTSPWNLAFWLAVMGRPELARRGFAASLVVAAAVVLGALTWCLILCGTVSVLRVKGETAPWEIVAKGVTGLLMLFFAAHGIMRLVGS